MSGDVQAHLMKEIEQRQIVRKRHIVVHEQVLHWAHTISSTVAPTWGDKAWTYKAANWYWSSTLWACEWRCASWYDYIAWSCVKCVAGTKVGNTCVIQTECEEWYEWHYDPVANKYECLRIGNCSDKDGIYKNSMPSYSVQVWNNTYPLWEDLSRSCKNSSSSVNPNKCEFSCQSGYWCPKWAYKDRCAKLRCYNWLGGESVWDYAWVKVQRNPTVETADVEDSYLDSRWEFVSSESTINSYIASNKAWCYYWCPEEHHCSNWKCMESCDTPTSDDTLYCSSSAWQSLYWSRKRKIDRPVAGNKTYQYLTFSEFVMKESNGDEWCYETCEDSYKVHLKLWWDTQEY